MSLAGAAALAFGVGALIGIFVGAVLCAWAYARAQKEMVELGFIIIHGVRYRLVEAPLPTMLKDTF